MATVPTDPRWALVVVCDAQYALPTAVCLRSVDVHLDHPPEAVYVLGEEISAADRRLLTAQVRKAPVRMLSATSPLASFGSHAEAAHITPAMFLKCLAPRLIEDAPNRLVYLDSDTLVRTSLSRLGQASLDGCAAGLARDRYVRANVIDPGPFPYFNSGVMAIDVDRWNELRVTESVLAEVRERGSELHYPDQDALNKALRGNIFALDKRWNYMVGETVKTDPAAHVSLAEGDPAVLHFCGPVKPWNVTLPHPRLRAEYDKYLALLN
jgi:lipopolysaccharide biosynthesis glycosyltransferase